MVSILLRLSMICGWTAFIIWEMLNTWNQGVLLLWVALWVLVSLLIWFVDVGERNIQG